MFKKDKILLAELTYLPQSNEFLVKNSIVRKFVNCLTLSGKKDVSFKIMMNTFQYLQKLLIQKGSNTLKKNPVVVFRKAIENTIPILQIKNVRSRNSKKATLVPSIIPHYRRIRLCIRWLLEAALSYRLRGRYAKKGGSSKKVGKGAPSLKKKVQPSSAKKPLFVRLAIEIYKASLGVGKAIERRNELHRRAYAQRAYARFKSKSKSKLKFKFGSKSKVKVKSKTKPSMSSKISSIVGSTLKSSN